MIKGIGIDIVDFLQLDINNQLFIQRVLSPTEYQIIQTYKTFKRKMEFLAGRIAAKEAYVKALGTGFRNIGFQMISIEHDTLGKPYIVLSKTKLDNTYLSISHSDTQAVAIVIIEEVSEV